MKERIDRKTDGEEKKYGKERGEKGESLSSDLSFASPDTLTHKLLRTCTHTLTRTQSLRPTQHSLPLTYSPHKLLTPRATFTLSHICTQMPSSFLSPSLGPSSPN